MDPPKQQTAMAPIEPNAVTLTEDEIYTLMVITIMAMIMSMKMKTNK